MAAPENVIARETSLTQGVFHFGNKLPDIQIHVNLRHCHPATLNILPILLTIFFGTARVENDLEIGKMGILFDFSLDGTLPRGKPQHTILLRFLFPEHLPISSGLRTVEQEGRGWPRASRNRRHC
jgi:hypothetical protein